MNLYLISQTENNTYDTFDSAVVAALDEETARRMNINTSDLQFTMDWSNRNWAWASDPKNVSVKFIGVAAPEIEQVVICASYNAG